MRYHCQAIDYNRLQKKGIEKPNTIRIETGERERKQIECVFNKENHFFIFVFLSSIIFDNIINKQT